MHTPRVQSGGRYPVLRTIAILYLVAAGVAAVAAIVGAVWSLFGAGNPWLPMGTSPNWTDRIIGCFVMLAGGFFATITLLAIAEVLKLFIDVEHNTRLGAVGRFTGEAASVAVATGADGRNLLSALDEETAEAALIRGH